MAFNVSGFVQAPWQHRTQEVPVPELKDWFDPGDPLVFVVRGLTANEIARANSASQAHRREAALAEALTSGSKSEITGAVQAALGGVRISTPISPGAWNWCAPGWWRRPVIWRWPGC